MAGFLSKLLSQISGNAGLKMSEQLLFDKVIGFRGLVSGVGTSTLVQNIAIALSDSTNFSICVLDTSFMYPTLYPMLVKQSDQKRVDYLDFGTDLSEIVVDTVYKNVSLVSLNNRSVVDMISSKDSDAVVEKLIGSLKSYFDVILVDLSYEMTNTSVHSAIKCNRIINISDFSLKSVYNLRKSLNTMATLGVPLAKANNIIINKVVPDIIASVKGVIENAGLNVLGEIPLSYDIARAGVSGKRVYNSSNTSRDILVFSEVIDTILRDSIRLTPLNEKFIDTSQDSETLSPDDSVVVEDDVAIESLIEDFDNHTDSDSSSSIEELSNSDATEDASATPESNEESAQDTTPESVKPVKEAPTYVVDDVDDSVSSFESSQDTDTSTSQQLDSTEQDSDLDDTEVATPSSPVDSTFEDEDDSSTLVSDDQDDSSEQDSEDGYLDDSVSPEDLIDKVGK